MKKNGQGEFRAPFSAFKNSVSLAVVATALFAAPCAAQQAEDEPDVAQADDSAATQSGASGGDEIIVSGTRLGRLKTPTPVLSVDAEGLLEVSRTNIGAALNDLPQFKATRTASNSGPAFQAGVTLISLRNLGIDRTLFLVDGRRPISIDFGQIPSVLVRRVDIVTGSASAAWGSSAVAGVVNVILDDKFEGIKLGAGTSISSRGDGEEYRVEGALGVSFAGERGNFIIGGEYVDNRGVSPLTSRKNVGRWAIINNPNFTPTNGEHRLIIAPNVGIANVSPGGLILTGVNTGNTFNPDGSLRRFDLGIVDGTISRNGEASSSDEIFKLSVPSRRYVMLAKAGYDLSDSLRFSAEIRHGRVYGEYDWFPDPSRGTITISADNAFLPATVRNQMVAAGETSFVMGRFNTDFSLIRQRFNRVLTQGTVALDGDLTDSLRWNAYYSHGVATDTNTLFNERLAAQFIRATDSIISPTTGQAVCRVNADASTANDDPACVPINLFGFGAPSQAARAYTTGTGYGRTRATGDYGGLTVRGEPIEGWAGPISIAAGVEARRIKVDTKVGDFDAARAFSFSNFSASRSRDTTKEAFAEIMLPLLKDVPGFQSLEFNGAARRTAATGTASVWSWKLGLQNTIIDGVRLRATRSQDILTRRGSTGGGGASLQNLSDPQTNSTYLVNATIGIGNPDLKTEISRSWTVGATIDAIPNLLITADYYDIKIKNGVSIVSAQDTINRCFAGQQVFCNNIVRGPDGRISQLFTRVENFVNILTSGIDGHVEYTLPLARDNMALRLASDISYTRKYIVDDLVSPRSFVNSPITQSGGSIGGIPRYRANTMISWSSDHGKIFGRWRYISPGFYNKLLDIEGNRIPAYSYFDFGFSVPVKFGSNGKFDFHADVVNAFDKDPPKGYHFSPTYDLVGRYFSVGVRSKF